MAKNSMIGTWIRVNRTTRPTPSQNCGSCNSFV